MLVAMPDCADNISAGTQVVSLVEVRGANNSLVHPRGAVGVVTRTPAGEEKHYLVRFPDGFEFSLQLDQLEVLKHFEARPGVADVSRLGSTPARIGDQSGLTSAATPSGDFDLESFIIYRCVVGSRAYGLDHDDSDTDRRGVYLAPADLQWSLFGAPEQFEDNAETKLPERPDYEAANRFLVKARAATARNYER